ncbi:Gfo/Idh/MocA family protein [Sulfitobacter algicola]|uniref:Gfo/Idh/MocA family oxidoreductase n=1 Tax=Parasulfitobacter algicola TaxID=2614809 RepID=A0ABX2IWF7_9RHOB|nr:Gfo/Idh/MocA family oxidoreductase [Sulfitobacter algicola]NSX55435.1 Gfo/Idh/MocA family oxidoreductase [Sulfitobacter algicola]
MRTAVNTIKYGIIGCGMMGREHIQNIALLDGAKVSVVYDPVVDLAQSAADLAGGAAVMGTLDDLLAHDGLDALVIVSPNNLHVTQLQAIADKRPLPILCEKPLYTDPTDAPVLQAFGQTYPAPVWIAMEYRYMPPIAALLTEADQITGGIKMLTIREHRFPFLQKVGNWNRFNAQTGGTLVEKCCHFFDLMRLTLGSEPVRVMASAGQSVNHTNEVYDGQVPDIWDNGYVIVDFENGARAMLELCMFAEGSRYQEEISAVGPRGKIEALVPGPTRFWPEKLGAPPIPQLIVSPRSPKGPEVREIPVDPNLLEAGDHNGSTFYQHLRFLEVVRGQGRVEVTLDDGAKAVAMGLAAQQSAIEGRVVKL